jgi:delta14-sterol reductase
VWSILLFVLGRRKQGESRRKGIKGVLHDIWFGSELNPTWWGVDLKMFAYQPSLIGLAIINWSFLFTQLDDQGFVHPQMWLYQAFWWVYLFTHYLFEEFMLSTWDIMSENFGFMLAWGDTVYVPFFYSIAGWFIIDQTVGFSIYMIIFLGVAFLFSLWIFRGANMQKYRFKKNPNTKIWFKPAKTLEGKILISGFWGKGRKLNYTGEILVYLVIVLTTGLISPIPLVLPGALLILLMQRAWRDDRRCKKKYGDLWAEYCKIAKYKMFPKIY